MTVELSKKNQNQRKKCTYYTFKKVVSKDTQRVLFHYRDKFPLRDLVQGASPPKPPKATMNSLRSCFLKAKAHDSKNHLAANIFKSGFSKGE